MKMYSIKLLILVLIFQACSEHSQPVNSPFPIPGGEFLVGTENILITKSDLEKRHLNVQLWYPADFKTGADNTPYIENSLLISAFKKEQYMNLKSEVIDSWKSFETHAYKETNFYPPGAKYPLVIFSHGFGMSKANYSSLCIELASHGYIVAAIDHPGSGLTILPDGNTLGLVPNPKGSDGKVVEFCKDASFVVSQLTNSSKLAEFIDQNSIGMIGHSLGGAAALNIGAADERFKAGINLDGYLFGEAMNNGVKTPFLSILQKPGGPVNVPDSMKVARQKEWLDIVEKSEEESFVVKVDGLMHFDFCDFPHIIPDSIRVKNGGVMAPKKQYEILSKLIVTFFNNQLKNKKEDNIIDVVNKFEEVSFEVEK